MTTYERRYRTIFRRSTLLVSRKGKKNWYRDEIEKFSRDEKGRTVSIIYFRFRPVILALARGGDRMSALAPATFSLREFELVSQITRPGIHPLPFPPSSNYVLMDCIGYSCGHPVMSYLLNYMRVCINYVFHLEVGKNEVAKDVRTREAVQLR